MGREKSTKQKVNLCLFAFASNFFKQNVVFLRHFTTQNRRKVHGHRCLQNTVKRPRCFNRLWKAVRTTWKLLDTTLARTLIITLHGFSCDFSGRGARWKVGGLTIENNFFILKIEKRNKIIVFDFQKVGAGAQKSGGAAALPAPPPPRSLDLKIS